MEWIRFVFAAICIVFATVMEIIAVFGVFKFKFVMNRMHSAAIGDTLALGLMVLGIIIIKGFSYSSLKIILVLGFLWLASSISSHVIAKMEVTIDDDAVQNECEVQE